MPAIGRIANYSSLRKHRPMENQIYDSYFGMFPAAVPFYCFMMIIRSIIVPMFYLCLSDFSPGHTKYEWILTKLCTVVLSPEMWKVKTIIKGQNLRTLCLILPRLKTPKSIQYFNGIKILFVR